MITPQIYPITSNLHLVSLSQPPLTGFDDFIGAWVYRGDPPFVVDPGPAATIPDLISALEALEVRRLAAIFLTHIHIDHAGGTGDLLARFPETPVICHSAGVRHLADPAKLWAGSLKTLGKTAEAYGPIAPVPAALLQAADGPVDLGGDEPVVPILTPGHAPHHVSYRFGEVLFGGEAAGVFADLPGDRFYLRPATPPRFFLETSVESLDALIRTPHAQYLYGHFGATRRTPELLTAHRAQLHLWAETIRKEMTRLDPSHPDFPDRCIETLLATDPLLAEWPRLPHEVRQRERGFLKNAVAGFTGYLQSDAGQA